MHPVLPYYAAILWAAHRKAGEINCDLPALTGNGEISVQSEFQILLIF